MMLTKRALKAKNVEELIDAVASMCSRNAIHEFHVLEYGGMPHLSSDADSVFRCVLPMSDLIGSLLGIWGKTWVLEEITKYRKSGGTLQHLLYSIPTDNDDPLLESINLNIYMLSTKEERSATEKQKKIALYLVNEMRKEHIEPNRYLYQIKIDITQEAYVGCLP